MHSWIKFHILIENTSFVWCQWWHRSTHNIRQSTCPWKKNIYNCVYLRLCFFPFALIFSLEISSFSSKNSYCLSRGQFIFHTTTNISTFYCLLLQLKLLNNRPNNNKRTESIEKNDGSDENDKEREREKLKERKRIIKSVYCSEQAKH